MKINWLEIAHKNVKTKNDWIIAIYTSEIWLKITLNKNKK